LRARKRYGDLEKGGLFRKSDECCLKRKKPSTSVMFAKVGWHKIRKRSLGRKKVKFGIVIILNAVYFVPMDFEFDLEKSLTNKEKHGIDFDEAQKLWLDVYLIEAPAKIADEPRFIAVGKINSRYWSAIYTYGNSRIRLISVRRARKQEIDFYESF
jgi:uncharacterized protein